MTKKELLQELQKPEILEILKNAKQPHTKASLSKMNLAQLKSLAVYLPKTKIEEDKQEPVLESPSFTQEQLSSFKANACAEDLFGNSFDAESDSCVLCLQENEEVALACKEITLAVIVEKKEAKRKTTTSKPRKETNVWGHYVGSKAALIDDALLTHKEGISIDELVKVSGRTKSAVSAHLHHLRKEKGINIVQVEGAAKGIFKYVPSKKE
jgi:hypothetical protein